MAPPTTRIPAEKIQAMIAGGKFPWWFPRTYLQYPRVEFDYFVEVVSFQNILPLTAQTGSFTVDGASDIMVLSAVGVVTDTLNTTFYAQRPLTAVINDTGSNRQLSNLSVKFDNWFGTAELPKYWDIPRFFGRQSVVQLTLTNQAAIAFNVEVALHGFKIFTFRDAGA